mmetsp:Transcript_69492/g.201349  ORF Transcript_69492/g.201349 Transcript_69492/m.201349 type:complete len:210 (+) Transcript_69492:335-964(+)
MRFSFLSSFSRRSTSASMTSCGKSLCLEALAIAAMAERRTIQLSSSGPGPSVASPAPAATNGDRKAAKTCSGRSRDSAIWPKDSAHATRTCEQSSWLSKCSRSLLTRMSGGGRCLNAARKPSMAPVASSRTSDAKACISSSNTSCGISSWTKAKPMPRAAKPRSAGKQLPSSMASSRKRTKSACKALFTAARPSASAAAARTTAAVSSS